jgi:hypothetical protein
MAQLSLFGATPPLGLEFGFDGYAVPERWVPLRIVSSLSEQGARVELLRLSAEGQASAPETWPLVEGLGLECPVMVDASARRLRIRILARGVTLAEAELDTRRKLFPGHLVLLVGMDQSARRAVGEALLPAEPILALSLEQEALPAAALDYDAISALVLRPRGKSLSPAQDEALKAWLASGGRLVLVDGAPAPSAFLGTLLDSDSAREGRAARFGHGGVFLLSASAASAADGAAWKDYLGIRPYEAGGRLAAGRGFASADTAAPQPLEAFELDLGILPFVAAWAALLLLVSFSRRRPVLPLLLLSLLAGVAALVGGRILLEDRRGETQARTRLILLPEGSGAWAELAVLPRPLADFSALESLRLEPSARISYGQAESGGFGPGGASRWAHDSVRSLLSLRRGGGSAASGGMVFAGFIPPRFLAESEAARLAEAVEQAGWQADIPPDGHLAWLGSFPETAWWERREGAWRRLEYPPTWLEGEAPWLLRVADTAGEGGFLVGRGEFPSLPFLLDGVARPEAIWALPILGSAGEGPR